MDLRRLDDAVLAKHRERAAAQQRMRGPKFSKRLVAAAERSMSGRERTRAAKA